MRSIHIIAPLPETLYLFDIIKVFSTFEFDDIDLVLGHLHQEIGIVVRNVARSVLIVEPEIHAEIILCIGDDVIAVLKEISELKFKMAIADDTIEHAFARHDVALLLYHEWSALTYKVERDDEDAFKRPVTLITGESLYTLPGDFSFASDYKKQADDLAGLGGLVLFLRARSFVQQYGVLLEFVELFKRLSSVYEIDLTYKIMEWLDRYKSDVEMMNGEILLIGEKLQGASYKKHDADFLIEIFVEDLLTDLETVKPGRGQAGKYFAEIGKALGSEFGSYENEDETED